MSRHKAITTVGWQRAGPATETDGVLMIVVTWSCCDRRRGLCSRQIIIIISIFSSRPDFSIISTCGNIQSLGEPRGDLLEVTTRNGRDKHQINGHNVALPLPLRRRGFEPREIGQWKLQLTWYDGVEGKNYSFRQSRQSQ